MASCRVCWRYRDCLTADGVHRRLDQSSTNTPFTLFDLPCCWYGLTRTSFRTRPKLMNNSSTAIVLFMETTVFSVLMVSRVLQYALPLPLVRCLQGWLDTPFDTDADLVHLQRSSWQWCLDLWPRVNHGLDPRGASGSCDGWVSSSTSSPTSKLTLGVQELLSLPSLAVN